MPFLLCVMQKVLDGRAYFTAAKLASGNVPGSHCSGKKKLVEIYIYVCVCACVRTHNECLYSIPGILGQVEPSDSCHSSGAGRRVQLFQG